MWTSVFEFPYIKPPPEEFVESGFPQAILDIIITCTCPPGGTVMDCFSGTGDYRSICFEKWKKIHRN